MKVSETSKKESLLSCSRNYSETEEIHQSRNNYLSVSSNEAVDGDEKCRTTAPDKLGPDFNSEGESSSFFTKNEPKQSLGLISFAVIIFYNVSGGPFGIEQAVRAGGSFYAIMGFLIAPFIWSIPEALMTAELGSTFPEASGSIAWLEEAFGKKAGLVNGYLCWISGVTDNAIYPALFMEYVTSMMSGLTQHEKHDLNSPFVRIPMVSTISLVLAAINYSGLEIVGTSSVVICIISMSPFIILCILGLPKVEPERWFEMPDKNAYMYNNAMDENGTSTGPLPFLVFAGVFLRPFANNLFWNLNSFDAAASFAADIKDVRTTFVRSMFLALWMTVLCYLIPLMVAIGATQTKQGDWDDGHMATIALEIGGPLLGAWTVFAAGISNLALFEAELSADSLMIMGMAERGYLPKVFATRSERFGTPVYGILTCLVIILLMGLADFGQLVEMMNSCYALSLLMEYAAFIKLRFSHDHCKFLFCRLMISLNFLVLSLFSIKCFGVLTIYLL